MEKIILQNEIKDKTSYCMCSYSHLSCSGNISTARCVYCGNPPQSLKPKKQESIMIVKLTSTKDRFLNQLLQTIAEIDTKKGKLTKVDCDTYTIEYTLPESQPVGSLD